MKIDVPAPRTKSGDLMVESSDIELIHRDLLEVSIDLINAPSQRGWIHWNFEAEHCDDADGDCVSKSSRQPSPNASVLNQYESYSELWTGTWWRDAELLLPPNLPRRILAVGIATDETAITMTGESHCNYNYGTQFTPGAAI